MIRRLLCSIALVPLAACLGTEGSDAPGAPAEDEPLPAAAGYELEIEAATLTYADPDSVPRPPFDSPDSVGLGQRAHLEVEVAGSDLTATLTPTWGEPAAYRGPIGDGTGPFVLVPVGEPGRFTGETLAWDGALAVERLSFDAEVVDGELRWTGGTRFEGSETLTSTDVFRPYDVTGRMIGRLDETAPMARLARAERPFGDDRPMYPWEPVVVELSEPVTVPEGDLAVAGAAFSATPAAGGNRIELLPDGWWPAGPLLSVRLGATYEDRSGNVGIALDEAFPIVGGLTPAAVIELDGGTSPAVESWGGDTPPDPPAFAACDGGCLALLRPVTGSVGLFVRVADTASFEGVRVVLRIVGMESPRTSGSSAELELRATAAAEGSAETAVTIERLRADRASLPPPYESDSGWITVDVDLAAAAESAGVALEIRGYGGEVAPLPAQPPTLVLVDRIEVL